MERIKRALELARQERSNAVRVTDLGSPAAYSQEDPHSAFEGTARSISPRRETLLEARLLLPGMVGDASHGFRLLRTQVLKRMRQHGWNTLAVVSAAPNEGKTFTATNLAIAIAATADASALLVDLDLRFPRLSRRFDFTPTVGIEDCLRGEARVADALVAVEGYPGLLLLPARATVDHSSELIGSPAARTFFRQLKESNSSRFVIYDLPPVLATDDALTFIPQVDSTLIVVSEGHTDRQDLARCMELLHDAAILGIVLNGASAERSAEYAY